MRLHDLKRFVRALVPGVYVQASRTLPEGILGVSGLLDDGEPLILYASGQSVRERDLTILHEAAHHLFDIRGARRIAGYERGGIVCEPWREDRADRWAEKTLELLETR